MSLCGLLSVEGIIWIEEMMGRSREEPDKCVCVCVCGGGGGGGRETEIEFMRVLVIH